MFRRFVILRKKPNMSVKEFRDYWENIHGPLVAKIPGLIKYTQYHVVSENVDDCDDPIDGIAELWFASKQAYIEAYQSPEYKAVAEDDPNLLILNGHFIHPLICEKIVEVIS